MGRMTKKKVTKKTAARPTKKAAQSGGVIRSSKDLTLKRGIVVIHGPRGAGKTWLAATASKHFGKGKLKDLLWLSFDFGATDGFAESGIDVDCIELASLMRDQEMWRTAGFHQAPSIIKAMNFMARTASELCKAGKYEGVVADTVSSLDRHMTTWCSTNIDDSKNKYAQPRAMLDAHAAFHGILTYGCKWIYYLMHSKALAEETMSASQKKRMLAFSSPGLPDVIPRVTGQGANCYIDDASLELFIMAHEKIVSGKKRELVRKCYPVKYEGAEAKNRWEKSLSPEEEPHLGKMFAKIKRKSGK